MTNCIDFAFERGRGKAINRTKVEEKKRKSRE
jgi:hypothetical protein